MVSAVNEPPTNDEGERHYCFENRKPTRPATFSFDDIRGWTVARYGKAQGEMVRTREAQIWSKYVAKISFRLERFGDRIELRPPKPIRLPDDFDCVNLWVRADRWYVYAKPPVRASLSLRLRDASGEQHVVRMGSFPWKDWFLAHRRVIRPPHAAPGTRASGGDGNGRIDRPAVLEAIVVDGRTGEKTAALYLDHVSFYREKLKPLQFDPPPGKALFPTTPDTILPTCHAKHNVRAEADPARATFTYRGADGTLDYKIDPRQPGFSGVTAQWNGGVTFQPMADGGPKLAVDDKRVRWETLEAMMRDGIYRVRWRMVRSARADEREVSATGTTTYQIKGKSLIVNVRAPGGQIAGVRFGRCDGLAKPKLVRVPFLTHRPHDPHVLCAQGLFVSAFIDWYVSDASTLEAGGEVRSCTSARYSGGCRYLPKTDGRRNDVRERIFLTVSPLFDEVLPNIPNPPNPYSKMMVHRAWWDVGRARMDQVERMYRWGLRGVMMEYNGVIWERGTDFTRRSFYGDGGINVGAEMMADFGRKVRGLGYLFGLHTNYCIVPPGTHRCWDEDLVPLSSDGGWQTGWGRCYSVKPSMVAALQRRFSTLKKERFGVNCEYIDQTTAFHIGRGTDYDARVPVAGKLRGQFEAYGRLLRKECEIIGGPVISEGPNHWVYAGLSAGNYGQMGGREKHKRNMLVDFDLLKIHPLQCDAGIGIPHMFYGRNLRSEYRRGGLHSDWFDRWIAWTLACGHIAQLTTDWGNAGLLKSFYMVQPAQQHYALVPVKRIRYFDGGRLVDTSDAIRSGALDRSQVCVDYANGLTVYVNGSWHDDWIVNAAGRLWVLPPAGFLLHRPDKLLEYSAFVGSRRIDCVETRDACYLDSRGRWIDTSVLATDGAAACFRDDKEPGVLWVVPALSAKTVAFRPEHFGLRGAAYRVTAYDFTKALDDAPYRRMGDKIAIQPTEGVAAYRVVAGGGQPPISVEPMPPSPAIDFVVSPRRWANVPEGEPVEANVVVWLRDDVEGPAKLVVIDGLGGRITHTLPGGATRVAPITLPRPSPQDEPIRITATCGGAETERRFRFTVGQTTDVVTDLLNPRVYYLWGYCRRGGAEQLAAQDRGPGYVRFQRASGSCGGKKRPAFAAPPVFDKTPHGYVFGEFSIPVPEEPSDLLFGIGINETAASADGVVFTVTLTDEGGRTHHLFEAHHSNGLWRDERISLEKFAGQWVKLRFQTDCGPEENASSDSARWAEPRIVRHGRRYDVRIEDVAP